MKNLKAITIADNESFLRQVSKPVVFPDKDLKNEIKLMEKYFSQNDIALALAAVQLGIPKRLIYLKNTNFDMIYGKDGIDNSYNEQMVLINPIIISKEGLTDYWEACASCLDNVGLLKRPYKIIIKYQDINGKYHRKTFKGFESTVLSHEIDHLDGTLHMDKAEKLLIMPYEERKIFRVTHGYTIYTKTGIFDELIKKEN